MTAEGDLELQDLYRDVLLDYFRSPSHKGALPSPDVRAQGVNPLCGDEIDITMTRKGNVIDQVRFQGHGCVISQASSAMMCEALEGRSLSRTRQLSAAFKAMMLEKAPLESLPEELEEAKALEGVRKFPVRIKCALLGWNTLLQGLDGGGEFSEKESST